MTAEDPADRVRGELVEGEEGDAPRAGAPFDLGDSRDLAAAVRAAWGDRQIDPSPPPEVPRPPIDKRARRVRPSGPAGDDTDPLAHLRTGTPRRFPVRIPGSIHLPAGRPRARTLGAAGLAFLALIAAAAFPIVSGASRRTPVVADHRRPAPTTTTSMRSAPTTAFTYPPETIVPPDTTAVPVPSDVVAAESPTRVTAAPTRTPTTSRPRTTSTTRSTPPTTRAPAPTTTQPPAPDDSGGSPDSTDPPPYP